MTVNSARHNPVFVVDNVLTVANSKTLVTAKRNAIKSAKFAALQQLIKRLVTKGELTQELSKVDVDSLITSMSILKEETTKTTYRGTIRFIFNGTAMKEFFQENKLSFIRQRTAPIALIAVLQINDKMFLWETKNYLLHYLLGKQDRLSKGFVPIVVPSGDIRDVGLMKVENLVIADENHYGNFKLLMQRYRTKGLIIVHAKIGQNQRYSYNTLYFDGSSINKIKDQIDPAIVKHYKYFNDKKGFFDYLLATLIHNVELHMKQYYINKSFDDGSVLNISLRSQELLGLLNMEKLLDQASGVEKLEVDSLRQNVINYKVTITDRSEFIRYLRSVDLNITKNKNETIILRMNFEASLQK